MPIYQLSSIKPVVEAGAYVHPTAVLIGDVIVSKGCFVGPYAVMRGDFGRLVLEEGANLQEHCCMHTFPGVDAVVERDGHIGHGAVLHGCTIKANAMVGINSVIMDRAIIGENSIVGAHSLVTANMKVPADSLVLGSPAKVVRELTAEESDWKWKGTQEYQSLSSIYAQSLEEVVPDCIFNEDRPRIALSDYPLKPAFKEASTK